MLDSAALFLINTKTGRAVLRSGRLVVIKEIADKQGVIVLKSVKDRTGVIKSNTGSVVD